MHDDFIIHAKHPNMLFHVKLTL